MILGVTGHRPSNIGGRVLIWPYCELMLDTARKGFNDILASGVDIDRVIIGMAPGWDLACGRVAIELGIPVTAAMPFTGSGDHLKRDTKSACDELLELADTVVYVSEGDYAVHKLFTRNRYIVENSDQILALWDGRIKSGTAHAVREANKMSKPVINMYEHLSSRYSECYDIP